MAPRCDKWPNSARTGSAFARSVAAVDRTIATVLERDFARRPEESDATRRPAIDRPSSGAAGLLGLQQQAGNAAVASLIQRAPEDDAAMPYDRKKSEKPGSTDAPGAKPAPKVAPKKFEDFTARILKVEVDGPKTVITIAAGTDRGAMRYTPGALLDANDKEYEDFWIESATDGRSTARVAATTDQVSKNPSARIKASKNESQEGKGD
jgi:hypothetical protein